MPKRKNPPVIRSVAALSPYMLRLTWKNGVEADVDVSEVINTRIRLTNLSAVTKKYGKRSGLQAGGGM